MTELPEDVLQFLRLMTLTWCPSSRQEGAVELLAKYDSPAEPQGLGAVVRTGAGRVYVRTGEAFRPWRPMPASGTGAGSWWDLQEPIEVLSEGVTL